MEPEPWISDPEVMSGTCCFPGTRVPVQALLDHVAGASPLDDFVQDFPSISRAAVVVVLGAVDAAFIAGASAS